MTDLEALQYKLDTLNEALAEQRKENERLHDRLVLLEAELAATLGAMRRPDTEPSSFSLKEEKPQ